MIMKTDCVTPLGSLKRTMTDREARLKGLVISKDATIREVERILGVPFFKSAVFPMHLSSRRILSGTEVFSISGVKVLELGPETYYEWIKGGTRTYTSERAHRKLVADTVLKELIDGM